MKVFATTAISLDRAATYLPLFQKLAGEDRFRVHTLITDPVEADVILFLDGHQHYEDLDLTAIRRHPLVEQYREKAFVYCELDQPWCAMPGLYVSMPRGAFDWERQRPCSYLCLINELVHTSPARSPDLLFSCLARRCHPVRDAIFRLSHPRALVEDTSSLSFFGPDSAQIEEQKRHYAEVVQRSKFVLCPRGSGLSSFRLFETMAAGRVPVIISDDWVSPHGPNWTNCSVRLPERRVQEVPAILEAIEDRYVAMCAEARRAWEEWFAPDVLFHRMVDGCIDIMARRKVREERLQHRLSLRYLRLRARGLKTQLKCGASLLAGQIGRKLGLS